ncbi:hypothetical protein DFJ43DRAFT_1037805 [Lentinula guzmanii]|uniref:Uncharacterized protein n=1 Tax=Lentinula guzmanii TaxID=2804957 RepID=A0AA38JM14_9AGAR|nr:hypothetical protein DFJ43DRAFT_1037805 [Lentinula guzmanii]
MSSSLQHPNDDSAASRRPQSFSSYSPMSTNLQHLDDGSAAPVEEMETQENETSVWDTRSSPRGWGYADRGWPGLWGSSPANNQNPESYITRSAALCNLRSDFNAADLSFKGRRTRNMSLDNLETKVWASVQVYRCSGEARRGFASFPTFTGPQILQRLEEVQTQLTSRINEQQSLTHQLRKATDALLALQARGKKAQSEIDALQDTQRELEYLKEIAYAMLIHSLSSQPLRAPSTPQQRELTMSSSQKSQGRCKFDVSLAELSRPEKQTHHYKTYKPPDLPSKAASKSHSEELTPQQEACKRYEERNLLQRRKKARERKPNIILILGLSDAERRTAKKNEKFRKLTKNCIAKDIEKSVGTRRIDAVLLWRKEFPSLFAAS